MTRPLQFIPFKSRSDKGWAEAWELYEKSFPYNERWNAEGYDRAFGDPNFEADGIWRGDEFIGILFHWGADGYRYVEHLAVSPALRGQNMGSAALSAFCRKVGRVILEIDPPADDISIRRLHFYERLGFVANPYRYIHPSFRFHAPPAGADELSRRHHLRRSPQFRGLRTGGSPPLFGARSPHSAEFSVKSGSLPARQRFRPA